MERWKPLAGTFATVAAVVGVEHFYLWWRLVHDAALLPSWPLIALGSIVPFAVAGSRIAPPRISKWWMTPVYLWLGFSVLLTLSLVVLQPFSVSPRIALMISACAALIAAIDGRRFHVKRVEIPLRKLPVELDGFTIAQLSDVHLGPTNGRAFMERVVSATNALSPDAIVITGDLVDAPVDQLRDEVAPLAQLSSKRGTFFITGNHEYFAGPAAWCAHLSSLGIRVLRNERVELAPSLELAGTDDSDPAGAAEGFHEDLSRALAGRDERHALVLLAHQPKSVKEARQRGVDLQLSGHTHGGQLWPLGWLQRASQPVVAGLAKFGETFLYVSRGTGHSGPPMRLATPAEITLVVLRRT